jgi:Na+-transporting methylmalonyl-CoA/oxaloacetate decarboxylase gamma subunit
VGIESFSFSLITALLGMLLVVLFLVLLSAIMFIIKLIMGEASAKEPARADALVTASGGQGAAAGHGAPGASGAGGGPAERELHGGPRPELPGWVLAAASAYLYEEERARETFVTARPWCVVAQQGPSSLAPRFPEGGRFMPKQEQGRQ